MAGVASLLLLELPRLPVLDDVIIAHYKLVAHMEARAQQRFVVEPPDEDARPVVAGVPEFAWLALYTVSDALPVRENAWRHIRYSLAPSMTSTRRTILPSERFRQEEINMPEEHGLLPTLGFFAGEESRLPFDYDRGLASVAPRPALIVRRHWTDAFTSKRCRVRWSKHERFLTFWGETRRCALRYRSISIASWRTGRDRSSSGLQGCYKPGTGLPSVAVKRP